MQQEVVMKKVKKRIEILYKADELYDFAQKIFSNKRIELLKRCSKLYKEADLSLMSEKVSKEADTWDRWING